MMMLATVAAAIATATSAAMPVTARKHKNCSCPTFTKDTGDPNAIMVELCGIALANTPPHIIECAKADAGELQATCCHLPKTTCFAALRQKGTPLRMMGCLGPGKTIIAMIAVALVDFLVKYDGNHVYQLDGNNLYIMVSNF
jgi:hypothetical protein